MKNIEEILEKLSPQTLKNICMESDIPFGDYVQVKYFLKTETKLGKSPFLNKENEFAIFAAFKDFPKAIVDMQEFISNLQKNANEYVVLGIGVSFEDVNCRFLEKKNMVSVLKQKFEKLDQKDEDSEISFSLEKELKSVVGSMLYDHQNMNNDDMKQIAQNMRLQKNSENFEHIISKIETSHNILDFQNRLNLTDKVEKWLYKTIQDRNNFIEFMKTR
jgi:uncharacterized cupredoxin-like copper-binding protein